MKRQNGNVGQTNPVDRPIDWTEFPDRYALRQKQHRNTFREIADIIRKTKAATKRKLPLQKMGTFGSKRTPHGCLRSNENMQEINGIELDYDDGDLTCAEATARLWDADLPAIVHTTASHTAQKPCLRILLPTSRSYPPSAREGFVARAYGVLKGSPDIHATFTQSQTHHFGSTPDAPVRVELVEVPDGRYIDEATDLDAGALGRNGKPYRERPEPVEWEDDDGLTPEPDLDRIKRALNTLPASAMERYWDWLSIGQAIHHETDGSAEGLALWDEASQRCGNYEASELEATWDSFGSYPGRPVTIGTLYRLAKRYHSGAAIALIDPATWDGSEPPVREWIWAGRIPLGQATYLTGPGSAGKSLLSQQLATCVALGRPFLGIDTQEATSIYLTCEDDADELHRRQAAICESMDIPLRSLSGKLHLASLVGAISNEMATFDSDGTMTVTAAFERVEAAATALGATFIILDNVAHLFAGNENIRNQAAAFVGLMNRLAATLGGSVLFLGHPNKAGHEFSGSTAWENQVRSRLFLDWSDVDESTKLPLDPDARVLRTGKANYGRKGNDIAFRWNRGAFITDEELGAEEARQIAQATDEKAFLQLLDRRTEQRRAVSESKASRTYAPRVFGQMPEGKAIGSRRFEAAMERLFSECVIERGIVDRNNGKNVIGIRRAAYDDDI